MSSSARVGVDHLTVAIYGTDTKISLLDGIEQSISEIFDSLSRDELASHRICFRDLVADLSEERIALLVRPEAAPAPQQAYLSWGYRDVGQIRPFPGAPVYSAMIKQLACPGTQP